MEQVFVILVLLAAFSVVFGIMEFFALVFDTLAYQKRRAAVQRKLWEKDNGNV